MTQPIPHKRFFLQFFCFLVIFALTNSFCVHAASQDQSKLPVKINNLESLLKSINYLSEEITVIQEKLQSPEGIGREQELRLQINQLIQKRKDLEKNFNSLAADVEVPEYQTKDASEFNWKMEVTEILGPLVSEIKKITSRPRKIEKLRRDIETFRAYISAMEKALKNIEMLRNYTSNSPLIEKLNSIKRNWESRQNEIRTKMSIAAQQLDYRMGQKKPLGVSVRELVQVFFKSRVRNLLLAFIAFILTWLIFRMFHKLIRKFSPLHKADRSFYGRFFDMLFFFLTVLFAHLALLAVLYYFGDWVLLSIATIFLLGIGWASKQTIPVVWDQAKLILNFGPVRENEVVTYNGLPYRVSHINLYTELINTHLDSGNIMLPLKDLLNLRSRVASKNEPWFPSITGDWIKLKDGTHGRVIEQTPETVKLELLGGGNVTYRTIDYLSQSPVNLSSGYRIRIIFGLDYSLQSMITDRVLKVFEEEMSESLKERGYDDSINNIKILFKGASPYSLDLEVIADFTGSAASSYERLQRIIPEICVAICNNHKWTVPSQQMRVHITEPKGAVT